jgi:hypothetical protein
VRTALPIAHWLDDDEAAGGPLGSLVTRLVGGADRTVPAGRRAISVSVRLAAGDTGPTITTPSGTAILDYPNDELPTATISTVAGDDVLVVETFLTP